MKKRCSDDSLQGAEKRLRLEDSRIPSKNTPCPLHGFRRKIGDGVPSQWIPEARGLGLSWTK